MAVCIITRVICHALPVTRYIPGRVGCGAGTVRQGQDGSLYGRLGVTQYGVILVDTVYLLSLLEE